MFLCLGNHRRVLQRMYASFKNFAKKLSEMKNVSFAEQMKEVRQKVSFEFLRVTVQALLKR